MIWRLVAVLALLFGPLTPIAFSQEQTGDATQQADCDLAYMETYADWQAYLVGGRQGEQPARPDRADPCIASRLQAQFDAIAAERAASTLVPDPGSIVPELPSLVDQPLSPSAEPPAGVQPLSSSPEPQVQPPTQAAPPPSQRAVGEPMDPSAVSLLLSDLPGGFSQREWKREEGRVVITHTAEYQRPTNSSGVWYVSNLIEVPRTPADRLPSLDVLGTAVTSSASRSVTMRATTGPAVGDATRWYRGAASGLEAYVVLFLVGRNVAAVSTIANGAAQSDTAAYAEIIAVRMRAQSSSDPGNLPPTTATLPSLSGPAPVGAVGGQTPRLNALQGIEGTEGREPVITCTLLTTLGAGPLIAVEAEGDWVAVLAATLNGGNRGDSAFGEFNLRDSRGRLFDMASVLDFPGYTMLLRGVQQMDAVRALGIDVVSSSTNLQPGRNALVLMMFHVAPDSQDLRLVPRRAC